MKYLPWMAAAAQACPLFVEFFPDPADVPDKQGEFVEVRLPDAPGGFSGDFGADSLVFSLDGKKPFAFAVPAEERLVLVHDSASCPSRPGVACGLFSESLPNSRESVWTLRAGACVDSVVLPKPKAGSVYQRRGESDGWELAEPTPGYANPLYEYGVRDCGIDPREVSVAAFGAGVRASAGAGGAGFDVAGRLSGCDSAWVWLEYLDLGASGGWRRDSVFSRGGFGFALEARGSALLRLSLADDDFPANNRVDTLALADAKDGSPLVFSEIHHCPAEPFPEWIEIYNASAVPLPLSQIGLCGKGGFWGADGDSVPPATAVLATRDSAELRAQLGFPDVRIAQVQMGTLSNSGGSLSLCFGSTVVDSVSWDKSTVQCPSGFNPLVERPENTPGFLAKSSSRARFPVEVTVSSRVVRMKGEPLRVRAESDGEVTLRLLDSASREVWREVVSANSSLWYEVPVQKLCRTGVNYVAVESGNFSKVVGIVLRP